MNSLSPTGAVPLPLPCALRGQHVLIFGASKGIGEASARLLVAVGARVTLAARSAPDLRTVAERLAAEFPDEPRPRTMSVDVTDSSGLERAFDELGALDHVFSTAAASADGPVATTPVADVRIAMERVDAAYEIARLSATRLSARGSLTFVSGALSDLPIAGFSMVAGSVGAIESMARAFAVELAPIRVNVIRPGYVDTHMARDALGHGTSIARLGSGLPLERVGRPEEVAAGALMCMANTYMTGAVIAVDGGLGLVGHG